MNCGKKGVINRVLNTLYRLRQHNFLFWNVNYSYCRGCSRMGLVRFDSETVSATVQRFVSLYPSIYLKTLRQWELQYCNPTVICQQINFCSWTFWSFSEVYSSVYHSLPSLQVAFIRNSLNTNSVYFWGKNFLSVVKHVFI